VELGPPATFLPRNPVVYLAVAGDLASIERLRAALAAGPLAPPVERDELPFVPHVTLDQRIDPARAPAALEALADYRARVTVEEVTLLEQDTTPDRIWHPVGSWALAAPAVVGRGGVEVTLARASRLDPAEARWAGDVLDGEPFAVTARKERVLVGTAAGAIRSGLCELHSLVVDQPARRQGIGSQLVRAVEDIAAGAGCTAVQATVPAGTPAAALLAGRGYRELARLADHLLLARELPTT
jgi:GNAT superfamily N-acetyltransferase